MDFSLTEEQIELQKWAHEFAEKEIRPGSGRVRRVRGVPLARRQEGRRGRSLLDRHLPAGPAGPDRPDAPAHHGGDLLGLRRHRSRDLRHRSSAVGPGQRRDPGAALRVGPQDVRHSGGPQGRARSPSPSRKRAPTSVPCAPSAVRDGDEWVLNGTKVFITNGAVRRRLRRRRDRRPRARPPRSGVLHHPQGRRRDPARARKRRSSASAPPTPPRSSSRTAASRSTACSAASTSSRPSSRRPARASRAGGRRPRFARSRSRVHRSPLRPSASPGPRSSSRSTTRRSARRSASRSRSTRSIQNTLADMATEVECARLLVHRGRVARGERTAVPRRPKAR